MWNHRKAMYDLNLSIGRTLGLDELAKYQKQKKATDNQWPF